MKEHPIIFSAESVRAILDGRKTQTRRVVNLDNEIALPSGADLLLVFDQLMLVSKNFDNLPPFRLQAHFLSEGTNHGTWAVCPCGVPGDRLWVRETFIHYPAEYEYSVSTSIPLRKEETIFRADVDQSGGSKGAGWRSPIHMPRWASRLTLEVVSVRVERVQEISEKDAIAESPLYTEDAENLGADVPIAVSMFAHTWDAINGKKPGYSWADNPWVWVIEFKRVDRGTA